MRRSVTFVLLLVPLLLSTRAWADEWTREDVALESIYLGLHAVDWGQTLDIVQRGETYHERNPLLGHHPSRDQVSTYFALAGLAHVALAAWLDRPARTYFQLMTIGFEAAVTGNNYRIGLRTAF